MIMIQFKDSRDGRVSPVFGPYQTICIVDSELRVDTPDGTRIAYFTYDQDHCWATIDHIGWTDVVIEED